MIRIAITNKSLKYLIVCFGLFLILGCGQNSAPPSSSLTPEQQKLQREEKDAYFSNLNLLEQRFNQVSFGQRVQDSKDRVKIVDSLFELELTPEERKIALVSQIDALTKLHATREIRSSERLIELSKIHVNDPDEDVARAAKIANTAVCLVTYIRTDHGKYKPLRESVKELLDRYPSDLEIARNLETVAIQLFQRDKYPQANEIMRLMIDTYSKSPDSTVKKYAAILKDRTKLNELNFRGLVQGIKDGKPKSKTDFQRGLQRLVSDKSAGMTVYNEILNAGRWLERNGHYVEASKIYKAMTDTLSKHPTQEISEVALQHGKSGIRRLQNVGQKVDLVGSTVLGDPIDPTDFEDKVVLLYFWSAENPLSLNGMGQLLPIYSNFTRDQFEIIAISTDKDSKKPIQVLGTQIPPWTILIPNSGAEDEAGNMIDSCSVDFVPYAVLLDTNGKIDKINLSAGSLDEHIRRLLRKAGKNSTTKNPTLPFQQTD